MKKKSPRFKLYELVEVVDLTGDGEEDYDFYDVFMMITIVKGSIRKSSIHMIMTSFFEIGSTLWISLMGSVL